MDFYGIITIILPLAVLFAYLNQRFIKMQTTIAIMVASLIISMVILLGTRFGFEAQTEQIAEVLSGIDFHRILMDGMLSFLLFAGALSVDFGSLRKQKWEITTLALFGTVVSTFSIAGLCYILFSFTHIPIPFIHCLLFGALISPTDPIAVLALCKEVKAPKKLTAMIAGESLFNDGVGIVIFLTIYQIAFSDATVTVQSVTLLFLQETVGGILYGIALGFFGFWLLNSVEDHKIEILITIAMVTGGYGLAQHLGLSGPLAMVTAGIITGHYGRRYALEKSTIEYLDNFWEVVDEILNAILFLLIGLWLIVIPMNFWSILSGFLAIPLVLAVRFMVVALPMILFKRKNKYPPHTIKILAWGGLRGGLAVALALTLPDGALREFVLTMTYAVVVFAVIVQGMTIKPLVELSKKS